MRTLKCGTRRSLLALAQSGWVAREIERLNPGVKVELVGIDTRGDKIVDIPLREAEGKDFFVAELDDALRSGRVDYSVHSMKDLSLDRPTAFAPLVIPRREDPRDVVVWAPEVVSKLERGECLRVGTSAPRRLQNIPPFLKDALPVLKGKRPHVEFVEIRGNVNTRLGRLRESGDRGLDGVVLALAGLSRLWADEPGRAALRELLRDVRWTVLPLIECPAAPAQGALAVECRADDAFTREALGRLHHPESARAAESERRVLARFGGGCHQRIGATFWTHPELGDVQYTRGVSPQGAVIDEWTWARPERPEGATQFWDGTEHRLGSWRTADDRDAGVLARPALWVTHSRALPVPWEVPPRTRVWAAGAQSWRALAARGIWVEGCAEGLGMDWIAPLLGLEVLGLPTPGAWGVLTHSGALDGWESWVKRGAVVQATYSVQSEIPDTAARALGVACDVFWASTSQFDALKDRLNLPIDRVRHYCGPGKTAQALRERGVRATAFPSAEEWRRWITNSLAT